MEESFVMYCIFFFSLAFWALAIIEIERALR